MPLQDHFHPPLSLQRHWHSFHHAWCTYISSDLNRLLPEGFFAEPNVQFGIEIDVAAFENHGNGHALTGGWTPSPPALVVPISLVTDIVEIKVFAGEGGPTLAGAIELVSPANKDRNESRDAFVTKCASYLQQGIGLIVVDVVTSRAAALFDDLVGRVAADTAGSWDVDLFSASFRPVKIEDSPNVEIWRESLGIGRPLPTLPLWLRGELRFPVNLEASYLRTCQEQRLAVG